MSLIYTSPTSRHNLYLGGKADAKSLSTLQQRNVKRILNVTPAKEAGITAGVPNYFENTRNSKIKYKRVSVYDITTSDLLPYANEIVQFISNGLHHGSVLVHCQRGVSRSATSVIMFLMRKANMTLNQSLKLCQRRRPMVAPNSAFLDQLKTYEGECCAGGHLTSSDNKEDKVTVPGKDAFPYDFGNKDSERAESGRTITANTAGGEKRKAKSIASDAEKKKRIVGPIGPPRGPGRSAAIGPAMGPPQKLPRENTGCSVEGEKRTVGPIGPPRGPARPAAIGPATRPPKELRSERNKSERGDDGGGKMRGIDGKAQFEERKEGKPVVGPTNCPM